MKVLVTICVYNEAQKIRRVLESFGDFARERQLDVLVIDDGSTDGTSDICQEFTQFAHIRHATNQGVGASLRDAITYAREHHYDVMAPASGNGKTQPGDVDQFIRAVVDGNYDFVKGSRFLKGGSSPNLPAFRLVTIKLFSLIVSAFMLQRVTDVTCLIGAYRLRIFDDEQLDISQRWLDAYEMEYYILYHVMKHHYRWSEIAANIVYPPSKKNYSKIKPFSGWWRMVRPWVYLTLGLRK